MTKAKPFLDSLIALLALVLAFVAAYWLDYVIWWLRQRASQTFNYTFVLWAPPLAQLLLGAGLIGLVWWLATRATFSRVIDVVYVVAGLAAAFTIPLGFTTPINLMLFVRFATGTISLWTMTGAALAAAGIYHFFRPRPIA